MNEKEAQAVADVLGGYVWNSGGGIYLICIERADGHLVVVSDEVVCEYDSQDAIEENKPSNSVILH